MMGNRKKVAALICGMFGCVFLGSGDWLMMYGNTAYHGQIYWLTEGVAQIPAWRNSLSMLVAFPAVLLYGIALFTTVGFVKQEKNRKIYHYLTAFGLTPWLCLHLFYVMILYVFAWLNGNGYEAAALPVAEALLSHLSWIVVLSEAFMLPPFLYWFYLQISGRTVFPKWMAFTNVLVVYAVLQFVKSLLPDTPFRLGFTNGLMSESMFIWFGIMLAWGVIHLRNDNPDKKMDLQLGDVQETALIPLAIRANETKRENARVHDEKAVEIIDTLGIDTKALDKFFSHEGVVARTIMFDEAVKRLLEKYPDAVCVNIGCGLDDRFSRVDNGRIKWFNVDLPDSIEVRRKIFSKAEREHMIAGDILKTDWIGDIPKEDVTIVIAEGLLMYFSKEQVRTILNNITGSFDSGFLLAELMHPKMMKENMHDTVKHTNAKFGWGTRTGRELSELDPKLELIKENSFWDEMKKYTLVGKIGSVLAKDLNNRLAVYKWKRR